MFGVLLCTGLDINTSQGTPATRDEKRLDVYRYICYICSIQGSMVRTMRLVRQGELASTIQLLAFEPEI